MKSERLTYIKNILLPCLILSSIAGIFTGVLIFLFKLASSAVIELSSAIYAAVRENPLYLPLLILGTALIGFTVALILKRAPDCRGGGIPTAVASLRGLIPFKWIQSIFALFASAMLTYLCAVPLGNEGPSVQMGTAVGRGTVRLFSKSNRALDRYIMTGGASAGFAAATGAPITGIVFAFEEAHRRFSPMIFMVAAVSVISGMSTQHILCRLFDINAALFSLEIKTILPIGSLWIAAIIGIICGFCAVLFTKSYRAINIFIKHTLSKLPFSVKIILIFVATALFGFSAEGFVGSGHSLIEQMLHGEGVWYLLIMYFCIRAVLLMLSNNAGITGGLFVPTLAFGAIIGSLFGKAMIALGVLPEEYYIIMVIVGMASFLSSASRTPITALTFSLEALSGIGNILPTAIGVTLSYLVIETTGISAFSDTVIEAKLESARAGRTPTIVDGHVRVMSASFAVGKEVRDILWPPTCVVLSVHKSNSSDAHHSHAISEGDILHLHYQTYDEQATALEIEAIVGKQKEDAGTKTHTGGENHQVPDI